MTEEQQNALKAYLRRNLQIIIDSDFSNDPVVGVKVMLLLDGEVIDEDSCALPHDHPDWREQR